MSEPFQPVRAGTLSETTVPNWTFLCGSGGTFSVYLRPGKGRVVYLEFAFKALKSCISGHKMYHPSDKEK